MYLCAHTNTGGMGFVTCSLKPERREEASRGASPSLSLLVSVAAPYVKPLAQYPEDRQVVALQGGTREAAYGCKDRDRGRLPSKPLVVVNYIDAGVLCLDLSSQLRLQPGHLYGAATEQIAYARWMCSGLSVSDPGSGFPPLPGEESSLLSEGLAHCHSPQLPDTPSRPPWNTLRT